MLNLSSDTTLKRKKFKIHIGNIHKHLQTHIWIGFLLYVFYFHSRKRPCLKKTLIILLFHSLCNIIKMKRKTHFKIATFNNIGSNLLTEVKPFENHVQFIFDFAAIPTRAGLFYLKNHFTGIIFRLPIHDDIVLCPGNCWCWVTVFITRKANFFSRFLSKCLISRVCDHCWIFDLKNKTKNPEKQE